MKNVIVLINIELYWFIVHYALLFFVFWTAYK